jgi:predicted regulator of Ras-like GTPase activity (Roadblock/LC7/MglB family)
MSFRAHLEDVVARADGALACTLMGVDGIEVETSLAEQARALPAGLDLKALLVELSSLFRLAREATVGQRAGDLQELSLQSDGLLAVARRVSGEYFLALALRPDGNFGKARYLLRVTAPKLEAEL